MWIVFFDVERIANHWYIAVGPAVDQYFYKYTLEYLEDIISPVGSKLQHCSFSFIVTSDTVFVLKGNNSNGTPIQFVRSLHMSFLCFQN